MVLDIIGKQKKDIENKLKEKYIKRADSLKALDSSMVKVIIGPRRAGKSFFALKQLEGKKFGFANFDDEKLTEVDNYDESTNRNVRDTITIWGIPSGEEDFAFTDQGLDGRCDYGWAQKAKGEKEQFHQFQVGGNSDKAGAQKLFDRVVDTLLRFYSS